MSWITLACVIAVAAIFPGNAQNPDPIMKVEGDSDIALCSYFVGIETSKCCHHNFDVTDKDLKGFTSSNSYYSSWAPAAKSVEECNNGDTWWRKCPCEYNTDIFVGDSKDLIGICSADPAVSTICRKACNQCGKDNYLTAKKILSSTQKETCCEYAGAYPFNCINKVVEEIYKPNILILSIENANMCTGTTSTEPTCLSFLYRRRASSAIKAKKLTGMVICHTDRRTKTLATMYGMNRFCGSRDANGVLIDTLPTGADGESADQFEIKTEHCDFNAWILAQKTLEIDCSGTIPTNSHNEIAFIVSRAVDHFDLDEIKVTHGTCHEPGTTTDIASAANDFDLDYEQVYQW